MSFAAVQHVEDSSIMDRLMVRLAANRQRRQGIRLRPEAPTMVAKVCENGGELWLGSVPTRGRLATITARPIHIQICCFERSPTDVWVDEGDDDPKGL